MYVNICSTDDDAEVSMESKSFTIEHNVYKDTFSKSYYSERGQSPQRGSRSDDASPTKRKYQHMQSASSRSTNNDFIFNHEEGQIVENSSQLLTRLGGLYKNYELSDVHLIIHDGLGDRREYPAHKLVLCSASEVFKVMLTGKTWSESNCSKVCLNEDPCLIPVFELFLEYLYSGKIALCHSSVLNVLILADKYDVKDLQEVCINYMCSHLVSTVEQNRAVSWLQYSQFAGHKNLTKACKEFICWNFYKILSCPDFLSMDYDLFLFFLKQSDLVVPDEFILYQGVIRWWLKESNRDQTADGLQRSNSKFISGTNSEFCDDASEFNLAHELFSYIRFPLMTHTQLNAITSDVIRFQLSSPLHVLDLTTPHNRRLNILLTVVEEFARKALMLQDIAKSSIHFTDLCNYLKNKSNESQVTLRNYTNEVWSTTLCIDKFSSLLQHEVRSVVFSSPSSSLLPDETNPAWDWTVELFPKGVAFQRCIMIGLWRNVEVHGDVYNTVRLALHCNHSKECLSWEMSQDSHKGRRDVTVCVLVTGVQDNVEHICRVEKRCLSFDALDRTRHINDLVPYHLLNQTLSTSKGMKNADSPAVDDQSSCSLLCGPDGDSLKITIVIKPSSAFYFKQDSS